MHPFSDADQLAAELPNGRLIDANSIIELRVRPARLTAKIAEFVDECWDLRAAAAPAVAIPKRRRAIAGRRRIRRAAEDAAAGVPERVRGLPGMQDTTAERLRSDRVVVGMPHMRTTTRSIGIASTGVLMQVP